jgi:hypothetical protein
VEYNVLRRYLSVSPHFLLSCRREHRSYWDHCTTSGNKRRLWKNKEGKKCHRYQDDISWVMGMHTDSNDTKCMVASFQVCPHATQHSIGTALLRHTWLRLVLKVVQTVGCSASSLRAAHLCRVRGRVQLLWVLYTQYFPTFLQEAVFGT